jgi:hypothetical protein
MASGTVPGSPPFDTLQNAINQASYGDTITVLNSYTFTGPLSLPNKGPNNTGKYITIQTNQLESLPATNSQFANGTGNSIISNPGFQGRVSPSHADLMPKVTQPSGQGDVSCVDTDPGAQYYRFVGIEFNSAANAPVTFFLRMDGTSGGSTNKRLGIPQTIDELPQFIQFDRCYIHSFALNVVSLHGMCLWTLACDVCNCYVSGFNGHTGDAQAIQCIGSGPYNIINNYIEGSTENLFFGRGDFSPPTANNGNPPGAGSTGTSQTLVQYNSIVKNDAWRFKSGSFIAPAGGSPNYFCKNLLEVKNGKNITIDHNFMMNSFDEFDQHGTATGVNLINYHGAGSGWEHAENITWSNNVISTTCAGAYLAFTFQGGNTHPLDANTYIKNIKFTNNLFIKLGDQGQFGNLYPPSGRDDGFNYVLQLACSQNAVPIQGLVFDHNTFVVSETQNGGSHPYLIMAHQGGTSGDGSNGVTGFSFTNNILPEQGGGFFWAPNGFGGGGNTNDHENYKRMCPGMVIRGNVAYTNDPPFPSPGGTSSFMSQMDLAHTNDIAGSLAAVGFAAPGSLSFPTTNGNIISIPAYSLAPASTYKAKATDGTDPGVNVAALAWSTAGAPSNTSVSSSLNPSTDGQAVTLTANVTGSGGIPTGTLQFQIDGTNVPNPVTLNSGSATYTTNTLAAGSHTITAVYSGDSTFQGSSDSLTQTVNASAVLQTTTSLGSVPTSINFPAALPITVTVTPNSGAATPTGTVSLALDGEVGGTLPLDANGQASFPIQQIMPGAHTVQASYSPTGNFGASQSALTDVMVNASSITDTVTAAGEPVPAGQNAAVTLQVSSR